MNAALSITGADLVRALGEIAVRRIDDAVRERAEDIAAEHERDGAATLVLRQENGRYEIAIRRSGAAP